MFLEISTLPTIIIVNTRAEYLDLVDEAIFTFENQDSDPEKIKWILSPVFPQFSFLFQEVNKKDLSLSTFCIQ